MGWSGLRRTFGLWSIGLRSVIIGGKGLLRWGLSKRNSVGGCSEAMDCTRLEAFCPCSRDSMPSLGFEATSWQMEIF